MLKSGADPTKQKADLGGSRTLRLGHRERIDCSAVLCLLLDTSPKQLVTWCKRFLLNCRALLQARAVRMLQYLKPLSYFWHFLHEV